MRSSGCRNLYSSRHRNLLRGCTRSSPPANVRSGHTVSILQPDFTFDHYRIDLATDSQLERGASTATHVIHSNQWGYFCRLVDTRNDNSLEMGTD